MTRRLYNQQVKNVSWDEFDKASLKLADEIKKYQIKSGKKFIGIYPIPRGGYCLGVKLSHLLDIPLTHHFYQDKILIVDEIVDNGCTLTFYTKNNYPDTKTAVWHTRKDSAYTPDIFVEEIGCEWIHYPWEVEKK